MARSRLRAAVVAVAVLPSSPVAVAAASPASLAYDGGLGPDGTSKNADCTVADRRGCWIHRNNVLADFGRGNRIAMGIGHARGAVGDSGAQLIQSYPRHAHVSYVPTYGYR